MSYVVRRKVNYRNDRTGRIYELVGLFTNTGLIISHLRYLASKSDKSQSWKVKSVDSIKLLLEYLIANDSGTEKISSLLQSFTDSLTTGTIDYKSMFDPSGLYWKPRTIGNARAILSHITQYTDYLASQEGYSENRVNPYRNATSFEKKLYWCAYYNKQNNVFLNHLSSSVDAERMSHHKRVVSSKQTPKVENRDNKRFPEDKFNDLLNKGFIRPYSNLKMAEHERLDYKNIAIAMLLNFGGLRKSEVFHIYTSDITLNPITGGALVRVYHPSEGASPDSKYKNRREYLNYCFRLKPRNEYRDTERLFAGWKDPLLVSTKYYLEVIFAPVGTDLDFLTVYKKYLKYQRQNCPESMPHPFAFTNSKGLPETVKNFQRMHTDAVKRIGLICQKDFGTTEHGHRHSYGYRLAEYGLTQIEIQKAMHHKNPDSCLVYIQPSSEDVSRKIQSIDAKYRSFINE